MEGEWQRQQESVDGVRETQSSGRPTCHCEDKIYDIRSINEGSTANDFQGEGGSSADDQRLFSRSVGVEVGGPVLQRIPRDQEVDVFDRENTGFQRTDASRVAA